MKGLSFHNRPRSIGAQISRMKNKWPAFGIRKRIDDVVLWVGCISPLQSAYTIGIVWGVKGMDRPYVYLIEPHLIPREGSTYEEIPHLMYDVENPADSGLCLFDPDGGEWSTHMLIADTTIPWAAKWLFYYELWHYDGKWRGGGVGAESVADMRRKTIYEEA